LDDKYISLLSNEVGGHRFQRIPPTEKRGRVHTSSVIVYIEEREEIDVEIDHKDLEISWFSGSGAGGQHRNKHQNCCRITHKPSGFMVTGQSYRNRPSNQKEAMKNLEQLLLDQKKEEQESSSSEMRTRAGTGQRGDKIRTIRFQDDMAKDHRNYKKITASDYMDGKINKLWE
jgi:peptide chain release factor 1